MESQKKIIEPFPLFGIQSIIYSCEEAAKILKANSYYIFAAAILCLLGSLPILFAAPKYKTFSYLILFLSALYFILGYLIRVFKSRAAAVLALVIFGSFLIFNLVYNGRPSGTDFPNLIFLMASYRSVKASFFVTTQRKK